MYGVSVWWPALDKITYTKLLEKVQRTACMLLSGALRTTPTKALEVMFHLLPVDIFAKQRAAYTAARLAAVGQWKCIRTGHSRIIETLGEELVNLDYITTVLRFDKSFRTICPSRDFWKDAMVTETEALQFYTDGSKLDGKVGAGVFCEKLNVSMAVRLPDYCSVYQAEVRAIEEVLNWLKHNVVSTVDIAIYVDSQAAIGSLESVAFSSKVALSCHSSLNEMGEHFNIQIIWVPGHSDVFGNCRADELARFGSTLQLLPERAGVGKPLSALRLALRKRAESSTNESWINSNTCGVARQVWPKLDWSRTKTLISLERRSLSNIVGILTGHCILGEHARRMGLQYNDFCRSCGEVEEEESVPHFLCFCPALSHSRNLFLGSHLMGSLSELGNSNVKDVLRFVRSSKWFQVR
jgi:ribonuclease HI